MKALLEIEFSDAQLKKVLNSFSLHDCRVAINILKKRIAKEEEKMRANKRERKSYGEDFLNMPVQEFDLSPRILNRLSEIELRTVRDVADFGVDNLKMLRGIGPKAVEEIRQKIFQ